MTDHKHYVNQEREYNDGTKDFDFRHGKKYEAKRELVYRTEKPYGKPLSLKGNYAFKWNELKLHNNKILYALILEV
jgi:hypothetical protein